MDVETKAAIREWRGLVNAGDYFAAHEALEDVWRRATGPEKQYLKGLIHVAVALFHYRRGNGHGARVKYGSALRYLAEGAPAASGLDVPELRAQLDRFFADLLALPTGSAPPPPRHPWPVAADENGVRSSERTPWPSPDGIG